MSVCVRVFRLVSKTPRVTYCMIHVSYTRATSRDALIFGRYKIGLARTGHGAKVGTRASCLAELPARVGELHGVLASYKPRGTLVQRAAQVKLKPVDIRRQPPVRPEHVSGLPRSVADGTASPRTTTPGVSEPAYMPLGTRCALNSGHRRTRGLFSQLVAG